MVDDKAVKNLPAHSGTIPPDAIFSFVHNDVQKRVSFADLQTQVDAGGAAGTITFPGENTIPPTVGTDYIEGQDVDLSASVGGDGVAVVNVVANLLNVGDNFIRLQGFDGAEFVNIESFEIETSLMYQRAIHLQDDEGAADINISAMIGVIA
jgi:hypothetical protein